MNNTEHLKSLEDKIIALENKIDDLQDQILNKRVEFDEVTTRKLIIKEQDENYYYDENKAGVYLYDKKNTTK